MSPYGPLQIIKDVLICLSCTVDVIIILILVYKYVSESKFWEKKMKKFWLKIRSFLRNCRCLKWKRVYKTSEYTSLIPYKYKQWNESFNALHWALKQPMVNNIAITGYLGSGKSSFWESYKYRVGQKYPDDNPLKDVGIVSISLAKFHRVCENKYNFSANSLNGSSYDIKQTDAGYKIFSNSTSSDYDYWRISQEQKKVEEKVEIDIERGILEQILYSVDSEDIPASRFKKLQEMPKNLQYGYSLIVYVIIVCGLVFAKYDKLSLLLRKTESLKDIFFMDSFYVWLIFLIVLLLGLLALLPRLYVFRITAISCHDFNIHFEENKGGLFSQNITELVYFFEKLNKRIVVIEDLERFDSPIIFIKLRELNHILNRVPSIKNLKFIYMIRDDTFLKYERTKFFDFIVPIVPVLTKDNSADFILRKMGELEIELGRPYIKYISKYLSDLRLLKNCKNEYFVYKRVNMDFLKEENSGSISQKECQRIFSLILYKNLYPRDFQKLLRHKGILYYLLNDVMDDYLKMQEEKENA